MRAQLAESAAQLSHQQAEADVSLLLSELVGRVERSQDVAAAHQEHSQQVSRMRGEVQRFEELYDFQVAEGEAAADAHQEDVRALDTCEGLPPSEHQTDGVPPTPAQAAKARARIEELELGNEMLRLELVGLEAGAWAVERAIREDLAFARPGEAVVRFSERPDRGANR